MQQESKKTLFLWCIIIFLLIDLFCIIFNYEKLSLVCLILISFFLFLYYVKNFNEESDESEEDDEDNVEVKSSCEKEIFKTEIDFEVFNTDTPLTKIINDNNNFKVGEKYNVI